MLYAMFGLEYIYIYILLDSTFLRSPLLGFGEV